jgi:hypothetical protein
MRMWSHTRKMPACMRRCNFRVASIIRGAISVWHLRRRGNNVIRGGADVPNRRPSNTNAAFLAATVDSLESDPMYACRIFKHSERAAATITQLDLFSVVSSSSLAICLHAVSAIDHNMHGSIAPAVNWKPIYISEAPSSARTYNWSKAQGKHRNCSSFCTEFIASGHILISIASCVWRLWRPSLCGRIPIWYSAKTTRQQSVSRDALLMLLPSVPCRHGGLHGCGLGVLQMIGYTLLDDFQSEACNYVDGYSALSKWNLFRAYIATFPAKVISCMQQ